ncbi:hypothetical protein [Streptomyces sp. NPDC005408]|uniref:hypothetical protein n=1 Tax=Streptomyces sp. NPDC005408 TaxID=3155341 RepID=UPI0033AAF827
MNDPRVPYEPQDRAPEVDDGVETVRACHAVEAVEVVEAVEAVEAVESDGYSATALGSHWFERPDAQPEPDTATVVQDEAPTSVAPDRVEGEVLRFGPGVTAAALHRNRGNNTTAAIWHGTLPGQPVGPQPPPERRRSGLRRYALAGTVLLAVLAFLAWQRYGPALAVKSATVQATAQALGCGSTADIVGVLATNGRPGTVTYRWERSDGTTSGLLREKLTRGQKQARLHLLWTFQGRGDYLASAELRIVSPTRHTATERFTYHCA